MPVPDKILQLIERFDRNLEAYKHTHYNEAQTRQEFIDPLFKCLGWDMENEQGYAEAYKDVVHEDAIKIGRATKAPDYSFRIGGARKFFVEAKKPAVDIKADIHPAYQLRRYAWSAKLALSILTDFEEFAVYDCRVKPEKTDKASKARTLYLSYRDYVQRWDELAAIFSREAILKGSFDKYAESHKEKRGMAEVDAAFLQEIERWRDLLARNIALRNPRLTRRELNFVVQRTIDRIIFLRICEDRGIEEYGRLMALQNGTQVYPRLLKLFYQADDRYNSGIFHFKSEKARAEAPDALTPDLTIDDAALKDMLKNLYYPDSPYEFSVVPADILGQVYEQFLGKVIRLTAGHQTKVEEKPEVKKAGGVYYTPTYIVEYIVKHTVGALLKEQSPKQAEKLAILDPACGSGSFLLGAYQYLLDWQRDAYLSENPEKWSKGRQPRLYQNERGEWKLTVEERKRILLNHIYGVDIDAQAVEVTKLSLLLKVLEGEDEQTLKSQMALFQQRVLPDLSNNIKCGNSLIGSDFYAGQQLLLLDEEEMYRVNAFDWEQEFPEIMQKGGFDAVIGNPPWISLSGKFGNDIYSPNEIAYLIQQFQGNTYMPNMYEYFVAQGLNLTKKTGFFGFIVPDRLGFNDQFISLRKRILTESKICSLVYKAPFPGITADTLIFVFQREECEKDYSVSISEYGMSEMQRLQDELFQQPAYKFEYFEDVESMRIISKIDALPKIKRIHDICDSTSGFGGKSTLIQKIQTSSEQIPTLKGESIGRYEIREGYWFAFKKKENVTGRTTDESKLGASPKILLRKTGDRIIATYDNSGIFPEQSLYFLYDNHSKMDFKYFLGILNSRLLTYYYRTKSLTNKKSIAQVKKKDLDQLPIRTVNLSNPTEKVNHDQMVALVERMLDLHKQLHAAALPQARTLLQRQIDAADRQIDRLVYELHGLTEEEIEIVEEQ